MRYFLDTEFWNRGSAESLVLISIGVVAEDGREYYAEIPGSHLWTEDDWLQTHVIAKLTGPSAERSPFEVSGDVLRFVGQDAHPEFWGYYCAFDWVLLCQLYGDFSIHPSGWPFYCHDLRQALDDRCLTGIKQPDDALHNALADAQWIAETWHEYIGESDCG